ncbi:MAG: helix-turn-helix transcriptional regulator [Kiritimatiellae bacterium]|nr:helix-turn-helix transcriptional regulator [Kiritimatiellia bacterium]MDD3584180.1 helix-turn-helix transcriptional regulator [Kiritimatiellia bacterium]
MTQWERLEPLVKSSGLTMKQVADIAKVVPSAVNKWKAGAQIRFASLLRLADYFGVPVESLGPADVTLVNKYWEHTRDGKANLTTEPCPLCAEKDREIVWLREQLSKAQDNLAVALSLKPTAPPAAPACGAGGGTDKRKERKEA